MHYSYRIRELQIAFPSLSRVVQIPLFVFREWSTAGSPCAEHCGCCGWSQELDAPITHYKLAWRVFDADTAVDVAGLSLLHPPLAP